MVKKKFIDKKKATTFTLTFRQWDSEGEEDGVAREQSIAEGGVSERIWEANCEDDLQGYHMPADKRKEILELGLPDDGYDYLQHLQALPGSTVKAPAQVTPSGPSSSRSVPGTAAALRGPGHGTQHAPQHPAPICPSTQTHLNAPEPPTLLTAGHQAQARDVGAGAAAGAGTAAAAGAGAGAGLREAAHGPSVRLKAPSWQPPLPDVRLLDARQLLLQPGRPGQPGPSRQVATARAGQRAGQQAGGGEEEEEEEEEEVLVLAALAGSSRVVEQPGQPRGQLAVELAELEAAMRQLEEEEEEGEGKEHKQEGQRSRTLGEVAAAGDYEGSEGSDLGDWFDSFVAVASQPPALGSTASQHDPAAPGKAHPRPCTTQTHHQEGEEEEEGEGGRGGCLGRQEVGRRATGAASADAASLATTYWRPERLDRQEGLQQLDDRFERLALQYEEEELGELEEDDDAARGAADISHFDAVLDEFLAGQDASEGRLAGHLAADADSGDEAAGNEEEGLTSGRRQAAQRLPGDVSGVGAGRRVECFDQYDPAVVAATKARLLADAEKRAAAAGGGDGTGEEGDILADTLMSVVVDRGERWDCESVLSLRSNISNHPGRILEPQKRSGAKGGAAIVLSAKTGIPRVFGPSAAVAAAADASAGRAQVQRDAGHWEQGFSYPAIAEEDETTMKGSGHAGVGVRGISSDNGSDTDSDDGSEQTSAPILLERRKGETAEEKKARKAAVKEVRRANRASKKQLKAMFKEEFSKQKKQAAGASGTCGGSTFIIP